MEDGTLADEDAEAKEFLLKLRAISTMRFVLRVLIVPCPSHFVVLRLFPKLISLNLLSVSP
mgnify:CR=1 FL=1